MDIACERACVQTTGVLMNMSKPKQTPSIAEQTSKSEPTNGAPPYSQSGFIPHSADLEKHQEAEDAQFWLHQAGYIENN